MTATRQVRTIVVVEAEPALRSDAREMFEAAGLQVVAFDDGAAALDYLRSHKDDVEAVFTDVDACGSPDGVQLANVIGTVCPSIAVIATAAGQTERPEALDPQVRFFAKPWNSLDIVNAMQDIVMDQ